MEDLRKEIKTDLAEIVKLSGIQIPEKQKAQLAHLANLKPGQFTRRGR